jgi:hypothetical protein
MKPKQRVDGHPMIIFDSPTSKGEFAGLELKVLEKTRATMGQRSSILDARRRTLYKVVKRQAFSGRDRQAKPVLIISQNVHLA